MMLPVFVDTVAWIAWLDHRDTLHQETHRVMTTLRQRTIPLVTSELVLLEVANSLSEPAVRFRTIGFIDRLRQNPAVTIVAASDHLITAGWQLYRQRLDKAWGIIDCVSFVIMEQRGLHEACTADHHFEQAGFTRLLTPA